MERSADATSTAAILKSRTEAGMESIGPMARDAFMSIPASRNFRELQVSIQGLTTIEAGGVVTPLIQRAAEFVGQGPLAADLGPMAGIECLFINEWDIPQHRVLLLSPKACYRVAFHKGQPCRFKRLPHEKVIRIVKCSSPLNKLNTASESGVQVFTTMPPDKLAWGLRAPAYFNGKREVEVKLEYVPLSLALPPLQAADTLAAAIQRAAELLKRDTGASWPTPPIVAWELRGRGNPSGRWKPNSGTIARPETDAPG